MSDPKDDKEYLTASELADALRDWWDAGSDEEEDEDERPENPELLEPVDSDLAHRTAFMAGQGFDRDEACNILGVPVSQYYNWVQLWKAIQAEDARRAQPESEE
jgi:hypothetical protein